MEEFMELLSLVNKLVSELKSKIVLENDRGKANSEKHKELSNRESVINETESNQNQREKSLQSIESVVKLKVDAKALMNKAEGMIATAVSDKEKATIAINKDRDVNTAEKVRLQELNLKHLDDVKGLKEGWDQLREKEKTYMQRMKDIVNANLRG